MSYNIEVKNHVCFGYNLTKVRSQPQHNLPFVDAKFYNGFSQLFLNRIKTRRWRDNRGGIYVVVTC